MRVYLNNDHWPKVKKLLLIKEKCFRKEIIRGLKIGSESVINPKLENWREKKLIKRTGKRGSYQFALTAKGRKTECIERT